MDLVVLPPPVEIPPVSSTDPNPSTPTIPFPIQPKEGSTSPFADTSLDHSPNSPTLPFPLPEKQQEQQQDDERPSAAEQVKQEQVKQEEPLAPNVPSFQVYLFCIGPDYSVRTILSFYQTEPTRELTNEELEDQLVQQIGDLRDKFPTIPEDPGYLFWVLRSQTPTKPLPLVTKESIRMNLEADDVDFILSPLSDHAQVIAAYQEAIVKDPPKPFDVVQEAETEAEEVPDSNSDSSSSDDEDDEDNVSDYDSDCAKHDRRALREREQQEREEEKKQELKHGKRKRKAEEQLQKKSTKKKRANDEEDESEDDQGEEEEEDESESSEEESSSDSSADD